MERERKRDKKKGMRENEKEGGRVQGRREKRNRGKGISKEEERFGRKEWGKSMVRFAEVHLASDVVASQA